MKLLDAKPLFHLPKKNSLKDQSFDLAQFEKLVNALSGDKGFENKLERSATFIIVLAVNHAV
jgi:hypothetical protein